MAASSSLSNLFRWSKAALVQFDVWFFVMNRISPSMIFYAPMCHWQWRNVLQASKHRLRALSFSFQRHSAQRWKRCVRHRCQSSWCPRSLSAVLCGLAHWVERLAGLIFPLPQSLYCMSWFFGATSKSLENNVVEFLLILQVEQRKKPSLWRWCHWIVFDNCWNASGSQECGDFKQSICHQNLACNPFCMCALLWHRRCSFLPKYANPVALQ